MMSSRARNPCESMGDDLVRAHNHVSTLEVGHDTRSSNRRDRRSYASMTVLSIGTKLADQRKASSDEEKRRHALVMLSDCP